jgi:hypothetical protein
MQPPTPQALPAQPSVVPQIPVQQAPSLAVQPVIQTSSATNELPSAAAAGAVHADKAVGAPGSTNELLLAATRGDRVAQYRLAQASDQGLGVPTNAVEAVNWYRTAAEQGYAEAEFKLGTLLHSGGDGLARDEAGAVSWYRKAADQGFAGAEFALGICYGHGEGVADKYSNGGPMD